MDQTLITLHWHVVLVLVLVLVLEPFDYDYDYENEHNSGSPLPAQSLPAYGGLPAHNAAIFQADTTINAMKIPRTSLTGRLWVSQAPMYPPSRAVGASRMAS